MKRRHILIVTLFGVVVSSACSGPADTGTSTNSPPLGSNSRSPSANIQTAPVSGDPTQNNTSDAPPGSFAARSNRRKVVDMPSSGPPPPPNFQEAPEDSQIATTMNEAGQIVELRVFRRQPQLDRVEATWLNANDKSLKIYLRSGQVIETQSSVLGNLKNLSTDQLLELAGVRPAARSEAEKSKTAVKTRQ